MFQTKDVKRIKTHILCSITFFRKWCRLRYNVVEPDRTQMTTKQGSCTLHVG